MIPSPFIITQEESRYSFTIPRRIEGWVSFGCLVTYRDCYLPTVTHPDINRAKRRATSLIETNALPLSKPCETLQNILFVVVGTWRHRSRDHSISHMSLLGRPVRTGLCFIRDVIFLFFRHSFSEVRRPIALKLCHMVGIWCNFITPLQKFGGLSPKKFGGQKHAKFRSILDHFRLWSRISPERLKISKIGLRYKLREFLLRLTKKVRWTLVH